MNNQAGPLLVFGSQGQVGQELTRLADSRKVPVVDLSRTDADICDSGLVAKVVALHRPGVVVNAAAYTAVDRAETESKAAYAINRDGAAAIAAACAKDGIPLIHISTDYVFDGTKTAPYDEDDATNPLGVYGASKLAGEEKIREIHPGHLILRTCWIFSPYRENFVRTMLKLAETNDELRIVADQTGCPTAARDIANAILRMASRINDGSEVPWGTYHFCGTPATSWHGFATNIFAAAKPLIGRCPKVTAIVTSEFPRPARRPENSVLNCARIRKEFGVEQPSWHDALLDALDELFATGSVDVSP